MKKTIVISIVVIIAAVAVGLLIFSVNGKAQRRSDDYGYGMGPGHMMDRGYGGKQYCPYCGGYLGSEGGTYGMGPGMMHQGWGMGPSTQYYQREEPLEKKEAKKLLENYVESLANPDLKLGKITEEDAYFEGEILTKKDVVIDKIIIDKNTGWMRSAMAGQGARGYGYGRGYGMGPGMMGPGMMGPGNQGYGMGPGMMGPGYRGDSQPYQERKEPLKKKDVQELLENYVNSTRNPNLKVGDIEEKDAYFEAEILIKKNDALVDKVLVDKYSGWMRSVY